jgi:uncharacterized protein YqgV (UPF0045/DUF77 family)
LLDVVELGSTATIVEGALKNVLQVVDDLTVASLKHNHPRVFLQITLDVYPGQENRLSKKHAVINQTKNTIKHQ